MAQGKAPRAAKASEERYPITAKQEAFALAYVETGNAAEAYRRAYDVEPAARDSWIYVEACQLLDNPKVARRVEAMQAEAARLSLFTIKQAFDEYEEARRLAMMAANPSAAVSAITGKVKLFGLEKPSKREITGPNGGPLEMTLNPEDLTPEARREILDARRKRAQRSGD